MILTLIFEGAAVTTNEEEETTKDAKYTKIKILDCWFSMYGVQPLTANLNAPFVSFVCFVVVD